MIAYLAGSSLRGYLLGYQLLVKIKQRLLRQSESLASLIVLGEMACSFSSAVALRLVETRPAPFGFMLLLR